ncbi:MAG: hypothetical protein RMY64_05950 [Nostoc sp. DedQUE08]|uniref:hypothetical protein n=1 Tax=Nostoc sp. DedQUE08 TaxID=3075393 RepID=UPI002AD25F7D|nr:hypothetical protein [Nostoc sp. DedQUE08]MDZ8065174.1 hypothetical protein [Nostoc sp. DedQUE08]
MATINISDLRPTGSDLFSDSEGYMDDLVDSDIGAIKGGLVGLIVVGTIVLATLYFGAGEAY